VPAATGLVQSGKHYHFAIWRRVRNGTRPRPGQDQDWWRQHYFDGGESSRDRYSGQL